MKWLQRWRSKFAKFPMSTSNFHDTIKKKHTHTLNPPHLKPRSLFYLVSEQSSNCHRAAWPRHASARACAAEGWPTTSAPSGWWRNRRLADPNPAAGSGPGRNLHTQRDREGEKKKKSFRSDVLRRTRGFFLGWIREQEKPTKKCSEKLIIK